MNKAWLLALTLVAGQSMAALHGKDVSYTGGGVKMKGYVVYDDKFKGKRPAVLVVHEWWGLNDYARSRADQLAKAGYVAMAVDMYGDGKHANHPDNAMAFMQEATKNTDQTSARFRAAEKLLKANKHSDSKKLAAIGYCFGGAVVLNMARQGEPLKGVASFHGALGAWQPAQPGKVTSKVLVMTGADDNMVPAEAVAKFDEEMKTAQADYRVISYPGAKHSFTNPGADDIAKKFGMPIAYNAEADKASWEELQVFLNTIFK